MFAGFNSVLVIGKWREASRWLFSKQNPQSATVYEMFPSIQWAWALCFQSSWSNMQLPDTLQEQSGSWNQSSPHSPFKPVWVTFPEHCVAQLPGNFWTPLFFRQSYRGGFIFASHLFASPFDSGLSATLPPFLLKQTAGKQLPRVA